MGTSPNHKIALWCAVVFVACWMPWGALQPTGFLVAGDPSSMQLFNGWDSSIAPFHFIIPNWVIFAIALGTAIVAELGDSVPARWMVSCRRLCMYAIFHLALVVAATVSAQDGRLGLGSVLALIACISMYRCLQALEPIAPPAAVAPVAPVVPIAPVAPVAPPTYAAPPVYAAPSAPSPVAEWSAPAPPPPAPPAPTGPLEDPLA